MAHNARAAWPKTPPVLSAEQSAAREQFMLLWHQILPSRYRRIESFNHGFPASLPVVMGSRTLEIGAGIGGHLPFENLRSQEYYALELRQEFCHELAKRLGPERVICGDIQDPLALPAAQFDRIVAVHVLEHLPRLPDALEQIGRLLRNDGVFDVVLPCEGELAYSVARKISAERVFRRRFKMDYTPIVRNEHVSNYDEIVTELLTRFRAQTTRFFPFRIPVASINLCVGMRLVKK
jgi:SAM-dependent methyltransferase